MKVLYLAIATDDRAFLFGSNNPITNKPEDWLKSDETYLLAQSQTIGPFLDHYELVADTIILKNHFNLSYDKDHDMGGDCFITELWGVVHIDKGNHSHQTNYDDVINEAINKFKEANTNE